MRDYEVITLAVADPKTGIESRYDRYLFRYTVEAKISTTVPADIWKRSLDERLISLEEDKDLDGYVWGVSWHCLYPGGRVIANSGPAQYWAEALGIEFHEVCIETNKLMLVFADLEVSQLDPGQAPLAVGREDHRLPPTPLAQHQPRRSVRSLPVPAPGGRDSDRWSVSRRSSAVWPSDLGPTPASPP